MKKIPKYCFKCGVIQHGTQGCVRVRGQRINGREAEPEFGPWLRVPSPNRRRGMSGGWKYGGKWGRPQLEKLSDIVCHNNQWRGREGTIGDSGAGHGGGSTGTSTTPAKEGSGNVSRNSSLSLSIRGSGNKGTLMEKEGEVMEGGDLEKDFMERSYGDPSRIRGEREGRRDMGM